MWQLSRRPAARHGRRCGFGLVGRPSQCNGKLEVGVAPGGRWAVAAMLDRGEGSRVAVPARTRATGAKQLLPRRGTCWTVRVARPRPLVLGRRLQYGMKPQMDCTGDGCLGCGTNVWCRRRNVAVVSRSSVAGRRGRTRVSVLQERGGFCRCQVPGSHPGPGPAQTAVVSPTKLCRVVPLAEGLRCKP